MSVVSPTVVYQGVTSKLRLELTNGFGQHPVERHPVPGNVSDALIWLRLLGTWKICYSGGNIAPYLSHLEKPKCCPV